jgi:hypothetical protein
VELTFDGVVTHLSADRLDALPVLEPDRWPAALPEAARMRRAAA